MIYARTNNNIENFGTDVKPYFGCYVIEELVREVEAGETARAGAPGDHGLLDDPGILTRCTHDVRHPGPTQWVRDPLCPAAGPLDQCLACAKDTQATLVHPILPPA